MKLTILTENVAGGRFQAEHGLSYLIEHDEKILFDTGHSDVFLKNAEKLKLKIDEISTVVLSHGHWDHGDGLKYLDNKKLICHPAVFRNSYRKKDKSRVGINLSLNEIKSTFQLITTKEHFSITKNIVFLGEIPRLNNFESQSTPFIDENQKDDFVEDDSALAIVQNNKLIVVSGCAHSGICNTLEYAKKTTGINEILAVIGGFHLMFLNNQTKQTIAYLKTQQIKYIIPSHCTSLEALTAFYNFSKFTQIKTGMILEFKDDKLMVEKN